MREQHGDPEVVVGRDLRLFCGANDPSESEEPQEPDVWRVLRNLQTLLGDSRGSAEDISHQGYSGDVAQVPQLDSLGLHLRDHYH